ncbi:MAG: hydrogenase expression/formation protein HypE [Nitrospirae bacterium]|nr:hydrogenase expression/formation protein HypE [Nitrospirota bacterium]
MMTDRILLGHGSGGTLMHKLIRDVIAPRLGVAGFGDSALCDLSGMISGMNRIAFTTDSFVVSPIFFPGGNIGDLSVYGTVNDLAVAGATPKYLSAGLIIEEGFPLADFISVLDSMAGAALAANVKVVAGDTKVVQKGSAEGIYINTTGIGIFEHGILPLVPSSIEPGDYIIQSAPIGLHGISIIAQRNGISFNPPIVSDLAPLNLLTGDMISFAGSIAAMRDPTRGGLSTTLCEIAIESGFGVEVHEERILVPPQVKGACELLGLDPMYVANEGVLIAFVRRDMATAILSAMHGNDLGKDALVIGEVTDSHPGRVILHTLIGGKRIVDMLPGDMLPRIC